MTDKACECNPPRGATIYACAQVFDRLRRWIIYMAVALIIALGTGAWAITTAVQDRDAAHADTEQQIARLACGIVDQIPQGTSKLADQIRVEYDCAHVTVVR